MIIKIHTRSIIVKVKGFDCFQSLCNKLLKDGMLYITRENIEGGCEELEEYIVPLNKIDYVELLKH